MMPSTATNDDLLRELRAWHADTLEGWGEVRQGLASIEARVTALEEARQ